MVSVRLHPFIFEPRVCVVLAKSRSAKPRHRGQCTSCMNHIKNAIRAVSYASHCFRRAGLLSDLPDELLGDHILGPLAAASREQLCSQRLSGPQIEALTNLFVRTLSPDRYGKLPNAAWKKFSSADGLRLCISTDSDGTSAIDDIFQSTPNDRLRRLLVLRAYDYDDDYPDFIKISAFPSTSTLKQVVVKTYASRSVADDLISGLPLLEDLQLGLRDGWRGWRPAAGHKLRKLKLTLQAYDYDFYGNSTHDPEYRLRLDGIASSSHLEELYIFLGTPDHEKRHEEAWKEQWQYCDYFCGTKALQQLQHLRAFETDAAIYAGGWHSLAGLAELTRLRVGMFQPNYSRHLIGGARDAEQEVNSSRQAAQPTLVTTDRDHDRSVIAGMASSSSGTMGMVSSSSIRSFRITHSSGIASHHLPDEEWWRPLSGELLHALMPNLHSHSVGMDSSGRDPPCFTGLTSVRNIKARGFTTASYRGYIRYDPWLWPMGNFGSCTNLATVKLYAMPGMDLDSILTDLAGCSKLQSLVFDTIHDGRGYHEGMKFTGEGLAALAAGPCSGSIREVSIKIHWQPAMAVPLAFSVPLLRLPSMQKATLALSWEAPALAGMLARRKRARHAVAQLKAQLRALGLDVTGVAKPMAVGLGKGTGWKHGEMRVCASGTLLHCMLRQRRCR